MIAGAYPQISSFRALRNDKINPQMPNTRYIALTLPIGMRTLSDVQVSRVYAFADVPYPSSKVVVALTSCRREIRR